MMHAVTRTRSRTTVMNARRVVVAVRVAIVDSHKAPTTKLARSLPAGLINDARIRRSCILAPGAQFPIG
jgi:hypothetical protein